MTPEEIAKQMDQQRAETQPQFPSGLIMTGEQNSTAAGSMGSDLAKIKQEFEHTILELKGQFAQDMAVKDNQIAGMKKIIEAQQAHMVHSTTGTEIPEDLEVGDTVTFINHAGIAEHGEILAINANNAQLRVQGKHKNDVQVYNDIPYSEKKAKASFSR